MNYQERKEKMEYLLYLLQKGGVRSTGEIAGKFGCSKRTVERMIKELKQEGYNIKYSRITGKYLIES